MHVVERPIKPGDILKIPHFFYVYVCEVRSERGFSINTTEKVHVVGVDVLMDALFPQHDYLSENQAITTIYYDNYYRIIDPKEKAYWLLRFENARNNS